MADDEAERERSERSGAQDTMSAQSSVSALRERLQELDTALKHSPEPPALSASQYCHYFFEVLLEFAARWKADVDSLPLLEVYIEAILSYARATLYLPPDCENVPHILERLALSCVELLLAQTLPVPGALWERFQSSVQTSQSLLQQTGRVQLRMLSALVQEGGVWANETLRRILSRDTPRLDQVHEFLALEGPDLLELRIRHLMKGSHFEKAALLAKQCSEYPAFGGRSSFKQTHLVCLCATEPQEQLMQKFCEEEWVNAAQSMCAKLVETHPNRLMAICDVDCKDVLEMVCDLESASDDRGALSLCSAFLTRQLIQGEVYCAWELTLFWSKLLKRLEPSAQVFLDRCRQLSRLSKTVSHILFLIKVIQAELQDEGLPICIEMCIQALQMASSDEGNVKATICKTISCLLPTDLEVKRACQLTEFLLEPTVDSYYAVEAVFNEPDQKLEEEKLLVPYSLRCELLLVFKTEWPFDPEFWDWKALKRHCLVLMGEQAAIVSSIDKLNDPEEEEGGKRQDEFKDPTDCFLDATNQLNEIGDERQKKREIKKLREKGFISARFRNWEAYVQYCVLCDKEFLGHRIVRHAQKHIVDGVYSCPICTANFDSKEQLIPHVTSHVKASCKERLATMKTSRALARASRKHASSSSNPKAVEKPVIGALGEQNEEHFCPVSNCPKRFRFFRNMMAHVKTHGDDEEATCFLEVQSKKVVCHFCRRQFVNIAHLNDHLQMHCGDKPYICVQLNCKARFLSNAELLAHRKNHAAFKAKCMFPNCGRIFTEPYMLYDHEARHYNMFTCKVSGCGKIFHAKSQLDLHQEDHFTKQDPCVTEEETQLPDVKTGPPVQTPFDQKPNCPTLANTGPVNEQDDHMQGAAQPTPSSSTNEMVTQQPGPIKIKHSIEIMLSPTLSNTEGPEQNHSFKVEPAEKHLEEISNSDDPAAQSSGRMVMAYSDPPGLENSLPSSFCDLRQTGLEGQTYTSLLYQNVAQEFQAPSAPDLQQSHAQNMVSFPASDASIQGLLPTQPLDWSYSHNETQTPLQDPKFHSYEWNRPEFSNSIFCKSDVTEPSKLDFPQDGTTIVNKDHYGCTGSVPVNPPCTFLGHQPVAEQVLPCMSNLTPLKSIVVPMVSPQTAPGPVVVGGTVSNISHPSINNSAAPQVAKQRHYCLFQTCTRNYSCSKSVTKHMKAAHPEFYVEWKLAKENSKVLKAALRKASVERNIAAPVVHTQSTTSHRWPYGSGCGNHPASPANPAENVLYPVLPCQPGTSESEAAPAQTGPVQANAANSSLWSSSIGNSSENSGQTACPSEDLPSHLRLLANQLFPSEMSKPLAGHPSQKLSGQASDVMGPIYNGKSDLNQISAGHDTANSFTMPQMHSGAWQSEIQTNSMAFSLADKADSQKALNSSDGRLVQNYLRGPALQNRNGQPSNPIFQSPVDRSSQLSALLSCARSCSPHFTTSITPDATPQASHEGLVHIPLSSHTASPHMDGLPRSELTSAVEDACHQLVPLCLDRTKEPLHDPPGNSTNHILPWQVQKSLPSGLSSSEKMACSQMHSELPSKQSRARADPTETKSTISERGATQEVKKVKHDRRTKWPAIVKDGKYICCRCFREFQSPKSLGGHLSKRSLCKDVNQTDSTAGLPPILLDHKSPQTANAYHQPEVSNINPTMPCKDEPVQSLVSGAMVPEFSPHVTLTQVNSSFSGGKRDGATLKPFIDSPHIPSLFESSQSPQGTFQKPCDFPLSNSNLPESTVIQHTGNLNLNTANEYYKVGFAKSEEPQADSVFACPLPLPPLQVQNNSALAQSTYPTNHLNEILRAEALRKMRELKGNAGKFGLSSDHLLAAIASLAQNLTTDASPQTTSPDGEQRPLMLSSPLVYPQKTNCEESVKQKLRHQILAGEFLRRGSVCREQGTDLSTNSESSGLPQSTGLPMVIQKVVNRESEAQCSSWEAATASPSQSDGTSPMLINTQKTGGSSGVCGTSLSGELLIDDKGQAPARSDGEDENMMEIQRALQRLDLDKEIIEHRSSVDGCPPVSVSGCSDKIKNAESLKPLDVSGTEKGPVLENISKPFLCEKEGCKYGAMTKEALFKHLCRVHNYTMEMINELKKSPAKLAPYRCQLCTKTFTRNTNLRIHCQSIHKLSREEFVKQKISLQPNKKIVQHSFPEENVSNNPFCTQNVSLNYATTKNCIDDRHGQLHAASAQNIVYSPEKKGDYGSDSFKEQTTDSQNVSELTEDLSVGEQVHSVGRQTEGMVMPGHRKEGRSIIRSPQFIACPNVQHSQYLASQLAGPAGSSVGLAAPGSPRAGSSRTGSAPLEKLGPILHKPKMVKSRIENPQKTKEKKEKADEVDEVFSPYRPYRCVHAGCVAAFTIQQNLILHYKAVHQSALPKFDMDTECDEHCEDLRHEGDEEAERIREFRCQVKDCSRIFPQISGLLQHYLQLHKFTMKKAESLMSNIDFRCDEPECASSFSALQRYVEHIEEYHKMATVTKTDGVEETFRCECDGCDRVYTTRSNVIRHVMKKHRDFYKLLMRRQKKREREREQRAAKRAKVARVQTDCGKENREKQRHSQKGSNRRRNPRTRSHWTSFGRPALKSLEEASGMCTKKFSLQYPCMLKGCDAVMSSERNVLRHYASHGLTERYIEEQRSGFIFCKKYSRSRHRDANTSEDDTTDTSENDDVDETGVEERWAESSRLASGKAESLEPPEATTLSDKGSETVPGEAVVVKRKRGRPRKVDTGQRKPVASVSRRESLRNGSSKADCLNMFRGQPERVVSTSSFKPMGFEMSFLRFLEKSTEPAHRAKRRTTEASGEGPTKRRCTLQQRTVNIVCERPALYRRARDDHGLVDFRNPLRLKYGKNVKIVVDRTFSMGTDLLLKQLQEMRPMVILKKWLYS